MNQFWVAAFAATLTAHSDDPTCRQPDAIRSRSRRTGPEISDSWAGDSLAPECICGSCHQLEQEHDDENNSTIRKYSKVRRVRTLGRAEVAAARSAGIASAAETSVKKSGDAGSRYRASLPLMGGCGILVPRP